MNLKRMMTMMRKTLMKTLSENGASLRMNLKRMVTMTIINRLHADLHLDCGRHEVLLDGLKRAELNLYKNLVGFVLVCDQRGARQQVRQGG